MTKRYFTESCVIMSCKTCPFYIQKSESPHCCFVKSDPNLINQNYYNISESCPLFEYSEQKECMLGFDYKVIYYNMEVDSCKNCPNHMTPKVYFPGCAGKNFCDISDAGHDEDIEIAKENYRGITPSCPKFEMSYTKEEQDYDD